MRDIITSMKYRKGVTMKYTFRLIAGSLICFTLSHAKSIPAIAVTEIEAPDLSANEVVALTNRLRSELINTGEFTVLERSKMNEILKEQGFQQTGCTNTDCAVEIGQLLNVEYIILGNIDKVGEIYSVNIRLVNAGTGKIERNENVDCRECTIEDIMLKTIKMAARKMAGIMTPADKAMENKLLRDRKSPIEQKTSIKPRESNEEVQPEIRSDNTYESAEDRRLRKIKDNFYRTGQYDLGYAILDLNKMDTTERLQLQRDAQKWLELYNKGQITYEQLEAEIRKKYKDKLIYKDNMISLQEKDLNLEKEQTEGKKGEGNNNSKKGIDEMAWIPGGKFMMGSNDWNENEKPVHEVTISGFFIDKTEVTQAEYERVMGDNPSYFENCPTCPVEEVSWYDAKAYCEKVGKRLPTEAEWEYAARAGSTTNYYWGRTINNNYAWNFDNTKPTKDNSKKWLANYRPEKEPKPVCMKSPNVWGLYDMSGNVWEWCNDLYGSNYYSTSPAQNPQGPASTRSSERVIRGGSCREVDLFTLRSAYRDSYRADLSSRYTGFRCVRSR